MDGDRVYIHCPGDLSAGIFPVNIYVDMPTDGLDEDEEFKDLVKDQLSTAFSTIFDSKCKVYINDEDDYLPELEIDF